MYVAIGGREAIFAHPCICSIDNLY
jgi:hypothetical protein